MQYYGPIGTNKTATCGAAFTLATGPGPFGLGTWITDTGKKIFCMAFEIKILVFFCSAMG